MKTSLLITCVLASALSASCSRDEDCLAADTVEQLRAVKIGITDYYLYRRTSGVSDKASFYQLYAGKPAFDHCGKAASPPVSDAYVDFSEGNPVRVTVRNGVLDLTYSRDSNAPPDLDAIEVVVE